MTHKDPEAERVYQREYRAKNRERLRAYDQARNAKRKEAAKKYRQAHREEARQREKLRNKADRAAYKRERRRTGKGIDAAKAAERRRPTKARKDKELLAGRPTPDVCDACGRPPTKRGMHFDHNHRTGHFRGWLCNQCNVCLGLVNDDTQILRKLLVYLERTKDGTGAQLTLSGV